MSPLISSSLRRKVLYAALVIAGGYTSYRLYKSSALDSNRRRLHRMMSSMFFLGEAMSDSAECLSLLCSDLRSFLAADADEVPRSLRQAFKIGQCPEFQGCISVISAAMVAGLLQGTRAGGGKEGYVCEPVMQEGNSTSQYDREKTLAVVTCLTNPAEELTCRDIREVHLDVDETMKRTIPKERSFECSQHRAISHGRTLSMPNKQGQRDYRSPNDLLERILAKLFTEQGIKFTSAVTGAFAHSCVTSLYDSFSADQNEAVTNAKDADTCDNSKFNTICSPQWQLLISECIQTLVRTAVTVYIDKTKDVNFYEEMVAGIINHQEPMKELLTSVCNGAVETSVRTLYDVAFLESSGKAVERRQQEENVSLTSYSIQKQPEWTPYSTVVPKNEKIEFEMENFKSVGGTDDFYGGQAQVMFMSARIAKGGCHGQTHRMKNFIAGVSQILAIPSNRRLVVDIAGTMTKQSVTSLVDVVAAAASRHFFMNISTGWNKVKSVVRRQTIAQECEVQSKPQDLAIKVFLIYGICLAICMHAFARFHVMQST